MSLSFSTAFNLLSNPSLWLTICVIVFSYSTTIALKKKETQTRTWLSFPGIFKLKTWSTRHYQLNLLCNLMHFYKGSTLTSAMKHIGKISAKLGSRKIQKLILWQQFSVEGWERGDLRYMLMKFAIVAATLWKNSVQIVNSENFDLWDLAEKEWVWWKYFWDKEW